MLVSFVAVRVCSSPTYKVVPLRQVHQPLADMPPMHKHRQQAGAHPPVQLHLTDCLTPQ